MELLLMITTSHPSWNIRIPSAIDIKIVIILHYYFVVIRHPRLRMANKEIKKNRDAHLKRIRDLNISWWVRSRNREKKFQNVSRRLVFWFQRHGHFTLAYLGLGHLYKNIHIFTMFPNIELIDYRIVNHWNNHHFSPKFGRIGTFHNGFSNHIFLVFEYFRIWTFYPWVFKMQHF